jgi:hypothetical protein
MDKETLEFDDKKDDLEIDIQPADQQSIPLDEVDFESPGRGIN